MRSKSGRSRSGIGRGGKSIITLLALIMSCSLAVAEPLAFDQFDYPIGNLSGNVGGGGWAGAWGEVGSSSDAQVITNGLTLSTGITGYSVVDDGRAAGNSKNFIYAAREFESTLSTADGSSYYLSMLIKVNAVDSNNRVLRLFNTSGSSSTGFGINASSADLVAGINNNNGSTMTGLTWNNAVQLLVCKVTFSDTAGADRIDVWLFNDGADISAVDFSASSSFVTGDVTPGNGLAIGRGDTYGLYEMDNLLLATTVGDVLSFSPPAPPPVPAAPTDLVATGNEPFQVVLDWTDNATNETAYVIERGFATNAFVEVDTIAANSTNYTANVPIDGTNYFFRVAAVNAGGSSDYSNIAEASTPDEVIANAPTNLVAVATGAATMELTWEDASDNETGFVIERRTQLTSFEQIAVTGVNVTNYTDSGLQASTRYYYQVAATNIAGLSSYSNEADDITDPPAAAGVSFFNPGFGTWTHDGSAHNTTITLNSSTDAKTYAVVGVTFDNGTPVSGVSVGGVALTDFVGNAPYDGANGSIYLYWGQVGILAAGSQSVSVSAALGSHYDACIWIVNDVSSVNDTGILYYRDDDNPGAVGGVSGVIGFNGLNTLTNIVTVDTDDTLLASSGDVILNFLSCGSQLSVFTPIGLASDADVKTTGGSWAAGTITATASNPQVGYASTNNWYRMAIAGISFTTGGVLDPYDGWAATYGISGIKDADFDDDGVTDFHEYALGGDPTNALNRGMTAVSVELPAFTYVYAERTDDGNIVYTLERTDNLVSGQWTNIGFTVTSGPSGEANFDSITNEIDTTGVDQQFFRLSIESTL